MATRVVRCNAVAGGQAEAQKIRHSEAFVPI
jgi:hypothetical protein